MSVTTHKHNKGNQNTGNKSASPENIISTFSCTQPPVHITFLLYPVHVHLTYFNKPSVLVFLLLFIALCLLGCLFGGVREAVLGEVLPGRAELELPHLLGELQGLHHTPTQLIIVSQLQSHR